MTRQELVAEMRRLRQAYIDGGGELKTIEEINAEVAVMREPREVAPDAKIDADNVTDKDCADLAALLEREHVKRVIDGVYATIDGSGFDARFKDAMTVGVEEVEYRLRESWGDNPEISGPDKGALRTERPATGASPVLPRCTCVDGFVCECVCDGKPVICEMCRGAGYVIQVTGSGYGGGASRVPCPRCSAPAQNRAVEG